MRPVAIFALLLLAIGCEADYNPPKAYGVGAYYSGSGRTFGNNLGGIQPTYEDTAEEDGTGSASDVTGAGDVAGELSEAYFTCIDDYSEEDYPGYCLCREPAGTDSAALLDCGCEFLVCIDSPHPAPPDGAEFSTCYDKYAGGSCPGPQ